MENALESRLNMVLAEKKVNTLSPRGLLELSIATIEAVKSHLQELHPNYAQWIDQLSDANYVLSQYR